MTELSQLIRPRIRALVPYSSARSESDLRTGIFLDANENPWGSLNRYPDPLQKTLKARLCELRGLQPEQLCLGNGSDEILDLLFRMSLEPEQDEVLTFGPTYGMYEVLSRIHGVNLITLPLDADFQPDIAAAAPWLSRPSLRMILLCSPNNPTGNLLDPRRITALLDRFPGLVVIDEAYQDFSGSPSWTQKLAQYPRLVVVQTLSKAWALAGARIGMAWAHPELISALNRIKPPYNISTLNQEAALDALARPEACAQQCALLIAERARLAAALATLPGVHHIYPSDANFLLVRMADADAVYTSLLGRGIVLRNRSRIVPGCLRITVGTPPENDALLRALTEILS